MIYYDTVLLYKYFIKGVCFCFCWFEFYLRFIIFKSQNKKVLIFMYFCYHSVLIYCDANASNFLKLGVPRPVAGSHPFVALKPYLIGPVPLPIAFVPFVTSVNES